MSPDPAAPVSRLTFRRVWIDETVEVEAGEDEVFALVSDWAAWPQWTPGLIATRRIGRGGRRFSMTLAMPRLPRIWVPCELYASRPGYVEWGGGTPGGRIRHRFELTAVGPARTRVRHVEYATGYLALILLPFERAFRGHDRRWSRALVHRFAGDGAASV